MEYRKNPQKAQKQPYLTEVESIRNRARQHMENGPVTPSYRADRDIVVRLLNEALATELVCVLRYRNHYYMASGLESEAIADEFWEHAKEEQEHADKIADRIRQLGGNPDMNPLNLLNRSHSEYQTGETLVEMIQQNLYAERIAIESYREIIQFIGDDDPTSRRMMEEVLAKEEEHADEMASLLDHSSKERTKLKRVG